MSSDSASQSDKQDKQDKPEKKEVSFIFRLNEYLMKIIPVIFTFGFLYLLYDIYVGWKNPDYCKRFKPTVRREKGCKKLKRKHLFLEFCMALTFLFCVYVFFNFKQISYEIETSEWLQEVRGFMEKYDMFTIIMVILFMISILCFLYLLKIIIVVLIDPNYCKKFKPSYLSLHGCTTLKLKETSDHIFVLIGFGVMVLMSWYGIKVV